VFLGRVKSRGVDFFCEGEVEPCTEICYVTVRLFGHVRGSVLTPNYIEASSERPFQGCQITYCQRGSMKGRGGRGDSEWTWQVLLPGWTPLRAEQRTEEGAWRQAGLAGLVDGWLMGFTRFGCSCIIACQARFVIS
jgi:hypothetical protein